MNTRTHNTLEFAACGYQVDGDLKFGYHMVPTENQKLKRMEKIVGNCSVCGKKIIGSVFCRHELLPGHEGEYRNIDNTFQINYCGEKCYNEGIKI